MLSRIAMSLILLTINPLKRYPLLGWQEIGQLGRQVLENLIDSLAVFPPDALLSDEKKPEHLVD